MAEIVVFASGSGSNFEAIVHGLSETPHMVACLITDNPSAPAIDRAKRLGVPHRIIPYGKPRTEAETRIRAALEPYRPTLIVLAGFMRLLSPSFVDSFPDRILNIHPSLLPRHPGLNAIRSSYDSSDEDAGITIHVVDHGVDTGPILFQKSFKKSECHDFEEFEDRIHTLEHTWFPVVINDYLAKIEEPVHRR